MSEPLTPPDSNSPKGRARRNSIAAAEGSFTLPFDPWRPLEAARAKAPWIAVAAALAGAAILIFTPKRTSYNVVLSFLRRDPLVSLSSERPATPARNAAFSAAISTAVSRAIRSPELLSSVAAKAQPPLSAAELGDAVREIDLAGFEASPDTFFVRVASPAGPKEAAALANLYAEELVAFTRGLQAREAGEMRGHFREAVATIDKEIAAVDQETKKFLREANLFDYDKETDAFLQSRGQLDRDYYNIRIEADTIDLKIRNLLDQILSLKRGELENLLVRYSENHPVVQERRAAFEILKKQLANAGTNDLGEVDVGSPVANGLFLQVINLRVQKIVLAKQEVEFKELRDRIDQRLAGMSEKGVEFGKIRSRLQALQTSRAAMMDRQRESQLAEENALGYIRLLAAARPENVITVNRWLKPTAFGFGGAAGVFVLGLALAVARELSNDRIKTAADLRRATGLPVIASAPDFSKRGAPGQADWATKAWTLLAGKLGSAEGRRLICGFGALRPGEGCSTWIGWMASCARQMGLPVVQISARTGGKAKQGEPGAGAGAPDWINDSFRALQSGEPDAVFAPPPGWEWNAERVRRWNDLMEKVRGIERGIVLIELPVPSDLQAIAVAEAVPQIVWVASSGASDSAAVREKLDVLRHTRCTLAGAVLNREPELKVRRWFSRWIPAMMLAASLVLPAEAQEVEARAVSQPIQAPEGVADGLLASGNQSLSVSSSRQLAPWQEKLTLGPGDVLNISLFGESNLPGGETVVGPDGTVSFFNASGLRASGLSIDELRAALTEKLKDYYRNPRVMISPVSFRSKKYYVLGAVAEKGVFTLDRPITIVEAVARSRGLSSGLGFGDSAGDLADLSRSFLTRQGQHMPVDLERLFLEGDLTQNIALEPNDYLYFAPAVRNEVYVLGSVANPGIARHHPRATLMSVITARGGFGPGAYRKKILVVRGSLKRPETYEVNADEILKGKAPDFRLQQKDIVYVSNNPWSFVGQILNLAISSYTYGVTVIWTGEYVTKELNKGREPYIPGP